MIEDINNNANNIEYWKKEYLELSKENEELLKFKNVWENLKKMLNEVKRQSEEREDRAFIYYDELIEGNEKLEKKHRIGVE